MDQNVEDIAGKGSKNNGHDPFAGTIVGALRWMIANNGDDPTGVMTISQAIKRFSGEDAAPLPSAPGGESGGHGLIDAGDLNPSEQEANPSHN